MGGLFVAFEGIDGSGKDTLAAGVSSFFSDRGREFIFTEEPSAGAIGRLIREMLDRKRAAPPTNYEFQRLFVQDRLDHIRSGIRPHLDLDRTVFSVRYWLSTLAYGMLEGSPERYLELHRQIIGDEMILPSLTLVLDVTPDEGLERIQRDGRHFDWFAKREKLEKIRESYLALAKRPDLGAIVVLDAMRPAAEVLQDTINRIESLYSSNRAGGTG